jgi:hypothetical protein
MSMIVIKQVVAVLIWRLHSNAKLPAANLPEPLLCRVKSVHVQ